MHSFKIFKNIVQTSFKADNINKISARKYTARRVLLYVPGDDMRKLTKAWELDVDSVAMDCEDTAINKKEAARETIRDVLDHGKPKKVKIIDWGIRVNAVDSGLCEQDLYAILTAKNLPDTIVLPKVDYAEHLKWCAEHINSNIKIDKKVELIISIESPIAVINLPLICKTAEVLSKTSKFTLTSLAFGSDNFCASIGATKTESSIEIMYARQKLVLVAKAFSLQALDMVYKEYKDLEGLRKQSEEGARMGYTGKQVIHPEQIPIAQEAFLPSKNQVEWATGLLNAFAEHQKSGKGAFVYKGSMVDLHTIKQAQNIINLITYTNSGK